MPVNDELGKRMKEYYENIPKTKLMRRTPVAIRIDGKAFHTFTKGFKKPFDDILVKSMQETMKYLCENIQGCVFGYTQSDEITLILVDYQKLNTSAWFDYEVQKMCSIAASMATMKFNQIFSFNIYEIAGLDNNLFKIYRKAIEKGAMFDARCFNIPKEEVCNLIYWRQLDAARNSIQMIGQAHFSHKELQNKSCNEIQDMLYEQKGINWNNYSPYLKRGSACIKEGDRLKITENNYSINENNPVRPCWIIDKNMPILKDDNRNYVEKWIFIGE